MSDKKSADEKLEKRRKALKNILAGSGTVVSAAAMQDKWARPVIETVILPAHAQTSFVGGFAAGGIVQGVEENKLLDVLVPSAHAMPPLKDVCVNVNGNTASVQVTVQGSATIYSGNFSLPFADSPLSPVDMRAVSISGAISADQQQVTGNVTSDGAPPSAYVAPRSSATCELTGPPSTTGRPTTSFPPLTSFPPPTSSFLLQTTVGP
jgi:hypothetical protein